MMQQHESQKNPSQQINNHINLTIIAAGIINELISPQRRLGTMKDDWHHGQ
jgi:hypothetical protein